VSSSAPLADGLRTHSTQELVVLALTVHVYVSGVASVLPAASVARTWKVWLPLARPVYDTPLVHDVNAALSSLHSNVARHSLAWNVNAAVVLVEVDGGYVSIVVSGAVRSITHVRVAGDVSAFPAASVAYTLNVCEPAASGPA